MPKSGKISHSSDKLREIAGELHKIGGAIEVQANLMDEHDIPVIKFYSQKRVTFAKRLLVDAVKIIRRSVADKSPESTSQVI